jgi:hypothetical protein
MISAGLPVKATFGLTGTSIARYTLKGLYRYTKAHHLISAPSMV